MIEFQYKPVTIPQRLMETSVRLGSRVAMRQKKFGIWQETTWNDYLQQVRYVAQSLLHSGLQRGDAVGVVGENCPEWIFIDMGIQMAGGVSVGIYTTNAWQQMKYILDHSECKFLFLENEEQVDKWLHICEQKTTVRKVIFWDDKGLKKLERPEIIDYGTFLLPGIEAEKTDPGKLDRVTARIAPADLALLIYTSGTTGPPKGAMLTHSNAMFGGMCLRDTGFEVKEGDELMSFLPLCHIFERLFSVYAHITVGYTINFVESLETIPQNLREIAPTVGYGVPRIWEKYHSQIVIRMADADLLNRWAFKAGLSIGMKYAEQKQAGKRIPLPLRIGRFLAHVTVFFHLKRRLGMHKMRFALSAAAPIAPDILKFYLAIGVKLVEGYGQTEGGGVTAMSDPNNNRLGWVGKNIPGCEIKLSGEGEIMVRSPGVFMGYFKDPELTDSTIQDGWLYSGDIGELDGDGYLKIVDRKKDIIITAGGKNIAPQYIENKLKACPYINDAIIIGDRRKFISAIIVLDEDNINKFALDHKIPYSTYSELADNNEICQLIQNEIDQVNKELARVQSIRKFRILNKKLYEEDGEVTPTMKVKRKYINATYADLIESMYT